jgi:quercetin dioxygenase-like cupin family protein
MNRQSKVVRQGQTQALKVLGTEVRFLCEAESTGNAWSLMEVVLPRDGGPPPHDHDWDEAYYVVEGQVEFTIDGQSYLATAGDFLYTPGGMLHGFRGASDRPARVLIFDAPAHAARFFREVDRNVTDLPRELPKVLEIGARTGIRFATPS